MPKILVALLLVSMILSAIYAFAKKGKNKKHVFMGVIIILSFLVAFFWEMFNYPLSVPDVFPLDGMVTREHPYISIHRAGSLLGEIYYSTDSGSDPKDGGTLYTGEFFPSQSGKYYFQLVFWGRASEVKEYTVVTSEESLRELGEQVDNLNETAKTAKIGEKSVEWGASTVSQVYSSSYDDLPDSLASGWGDDTGGRTSFTIEEINEGKLNGQIIFNTISDSVIGDEKNFVAARENVEIPPEERLWNGNLIDVEIGKEYLIRIYGHNNSPNGYDCVAEDVEIQFQIPEESGRSVVVHGLISSSNANPSLYWDGVIFTCETPFRLEYVQGSAKISNNGIGHGTSLHLSDSIVNNWVTIGYSELDGRIPGCYQYAFYVTIRVRIVEADGAE